MKARTLSLCIMGGVVLSASVVLAVLGVSSLLMPGDAPKVAASQPADEHGFAGGDVPGAPFAPFIVPGPGDFGDAWEAPPARAAAKPCAADEIKEARGAAFADAGFKVTGPYQHANLSLFLVHGPGKMRDVEVMTLQEALERRVAVVHEGFLAIDNFGDKPLFIQAGDIIKGGTQDRVLPNDYMIAAGAKRFPVSVFCVEQGRSVPRVGEISTSFSVSCESLPTRDLRLAAYRRAQMDVWNGVARIQENLSRNLGASVRAELSRTSLQLTLEHPTVRNAATDYFAKLLPAVDKSDDAVGVVVAVNGKIVSADLYANPSLFRSFWPKLTKAATVEALSARTDVAAATDLNAEAVRTFLNTAETGDAFRLGTGGGLELFRQESAHALLFDACTTGGDKGVLHRTILAK